jgi:hypothetical protein
VRQSVGEVNGRLIVGPTKTYATRTITLPDALAAQLLTFKDSQSALAWGSEVANGAHRVRVTPRTHHDRACGGSKPEG